MSIIISVLIVAIDIFNLITNIVRSSNWTLFVILLIGSITIILLETYVFLRLAYINTIDYILSMLFIAEGLVLIEEYMINRLGGYRKTVLFIVFLITVFFLCYRGIKYGKNIKEYEKRKKDIWNLKQLYEYDNQNEDNNIPVGRICISEKEADYDLLNREYIIEQINPDFELVFVGLNGLTIEEELKMDIDKVNSFMTVNEAREKYEMKPLEGGDAPNNSAFLQNKNSQAMAQQQAQMGGGFNPNEGEEGEQNPFDLYAEKTDEDEANKGGLREEFVKAFDNFLKQEEYE